MGHFTYFPAKGLAYNVEEDAARNMLQTLMDLASGAAGVWRRRWCE
jgi:hypothetical protein